MAKVSVLADLAILGAIVLDSDMVEFPPDPQLGMMVVKGQALYAYLVIGGYETWFPLVRNASSTFVFTQTIPSAQWTINHGMGSEHIWYQVQDQNGVPMYPAGEDKSNPNILILSFTEPAAGTAVLVSSSVIEATEIKAQIITIGDVEITTGGISIAGDQVLTLSKVGDAVTTEITAQSYTKDQLYTKTEVQALVDSSVKTAIDQYAAGTYVN